MARREFAKEFASALAALEAAPLEAVVGMDEVGRGCLAGPMAIGVAALRAGASAADWRLAQLRDSKALSAKKREAIAAWLGEVFEIHLCVFGAEFIDAAGLSACYAAAREWAAARYAGASKLLVIDGPAMGGEGVLGVAKADAKFPAVMAAAIAAKVWRDGFMARVSDPGYGYAAHKGYGTAAHRAAIARLGLSALHRRSFCRNIAASTGAVGGSDATNAAGGAGGTLQMQVISL